MVQRQQRCFPPRIFSTPAGEIKSPHAPRMRNSAALYGPQLGFSPYELTAGDFFPRPCVLLTFPPQGDAQFFASSEGRRGRISNELVTISQLTSGCCNLPPLLHRIHIFCARWCAAEFFPEGKVLFFTAHARNGVIIRGLRWYMNNFEPRPRAFAGFSLAEPAASR